MNLSVAKVAAWICDLLLTTNTCFKHCRAFTPISSSATLSASAVVADKAKALPSPAVSAVLTVAMLVLRLRSFSESIFSSSPARCSSRSMKSSLSVQRFSNKIGTTTSSCLPASEANASDEATLLIACKPALLHRIATGALAGGFV